MSLPASDDFNRADAGTLGSNWTQSLGTQGIASNKAAGKTNGVNNIAYWSADTWGADHYSQLTPRAGDFSFVGPMVRINGSGNGYQALYEGVGSVVNVYRLTGGSGTLLGSTGTGTTADEPIKLTAEGATIKAYKNGVQIGSDFSDSTYTTGSAGFLAYSDTSLCDDWTGDNLTAAATFTPAPSAATLTGRGTALGFALNMPDEL